MYRRPKEIKHLKRKSKVHAINSPKRSKLKVGRSDLTSGEAESSRRKCTCKRCQKGKQHKHKRTELFDPFEGCSSPDDILDELLFDEYMDDFDKNYEPMSDYEGCTLGEAEEWGFCLPEEYDSSGEYTWLYGKGFKGE